MPAPTVTFLGAAGTVTGSKHLIDTGNSKVLLDCGLFQGLKALRDRNWKQPPVDPKRLDAVVISHAHIDHVGYLPALVKHGYRGPVYCTPATADLLAIMLRDSAYLQEEQAADANRHRYSRHQTALPLYTVADAEKTLTLVASRDYGTPFPAADDVRVAYRPAGHIMGSATVSLELDGGARKTVVFSGDLGRWNRPVLHDPDPVREADVLLCESTYGDRTHVPDPLDELARVVGEVAQRGGALIVPAFAVGRTQELVYYLRELEQKRLIPTLPVYVDSPMAISVTDIYRRHTDEHDITMTRLLSQGESPFETAQFGLSRTPQESRKLNELRGPFIVISSSGMATGGRVLHHLRHRLGDDRTTVLLIGFQAAGTRGRALQDGARVLRMFGHDVKVRAHVERLDGLSAHADQSEILKWLGGFERPPRETYLVHGEPNAAAALAEVMGQRLKWKARPAADGERVTVTA